MSGYRRPPSRAWLKKYPQKSRARMAYGAPRVQRSLRTYPTAVGGETKYFDAEKTATAVAASADWTGTEYDPGTLNTLFAPVKGTGINQRVGRGVQVIKIRIRGMIYTSAQVDQTAADAASYIRLALVQDTQTNGAQAQGEQIFQDPTAASAFNAACAFQSLDNLGRFKVLKDKILTIQNPNISYDGTNMEQQGLVRPFKMNCVFKSPVVVHFNETNGGTVADIVDNSWHVVANTSNAIQAPTIVYQARVYYKDI